jgi:transcriptional regulator with XRE-family HTH domain
MRGLVMANPVIDDMNDPEFRKLLAQEELILEVTETICDILEKEKISRKGLADRLGKTKGFISHLLNGGRNLTLRTVADILHVLGYKVSLKPQKLRRESNVIDIRTYRDRYVMRKIPNYMWGELKTSFLDNNREFKKAISG